MRGIRRQLLLDLVTRGALAFVGGWIRPGLTTSTATTTPSGAVQQVALTVSSPSDGADVAFPFPASGTATPGARVTCYNANTGAALASTVADPAGDWSLTVTGPG